MEVRTEDIGPDAKDIVVLQQTELLKKKRGNVYYRQFKSILGARIGSLLFTIVHFLWLRCTFSFDCFFNLIYAFN